MHIPDGFLDLPVAGALFALAGLFLAVSVRRAEQALDQGTGPLLGVTAAGVLAAQMLNWPIPGGTSAHFVGGGLLAILLGPSLGALTMTCVVVVQALVFGDGGVAALGANVLNMAIIDVYVGYGVYRLLANRHQSVAVFTAGWLGVAAAGLAAGIELGVSSTFAYDLATTVAIMGGGHLILGLIEGAITLLVFRAIVASRPDIVSGLVGRRTTG